MARQSVIGERIYERVEEMRKADPNLSQTEAFIRLGQEMDKKPATIGASYYRVVRNHKKTEAGNRKAQRATSQAKRQAERGMEPMPRRVVVDRNQQVADNLDEMAQVLHRQIDVLIQQYKVEHERVARMRELIGG